MIPEYIPYIKYVIAPGTRFERDKKVLFDPDGEVAKGEPLLNYGWAPSGLKEFVKALYEAKKGGLMGFSDFYEKVRNSDQNILEILRNEGLIGETLPALVVITIKENVEVPALLVKIDRMFFKRCQKCAQSWRNNRPQTDFIEFLKELGIGKVIDVFQCSRQLCMFLCEHYRYCEKSYTSTEGLSEIESYKIECLKALLKFVAGKAPEIQRYECIAKERIPSKVRFKESEKEVPLTFENFKIVINKSKPVNYTSCIERPLRFDFIPIRYFFFDHKTWEKMQKHRYCKTPGRRNMDALPANLLSEFISFYEEYRDGTQLIAPINHKGVLEAFLNVSDIRFELKHYVEHKCSICGATHRIINIPIKAMFRDSEVFRHEAYFANLLWEKLWEIYPKQLCALFSGKSHIEISESVLLKREVKVKELDPKSRFSSSSYDYVVDLFPIGKKRRLIFDLTTGLWKKSGFHEVGRTSEEYIEIWKELLYNVPKKLTDTYIVWYIVINSTEEKFFDETAPNGVKNIEGLVDIITSQDRQITLIVKSDDDFNFLDLDQNRLIVVPVFNSTPTKGEARWEIRRLESGEYSKLLIWKLVSYLLA
ncbi:MAG: hypothetical protein QXR44_04380 [Thermoproteota archaeon]|nr:hypothetical protein [Candidatus Brockarchaeota archaeon]